MQGLSYPYAENHNYWDNGHNQDNPYCTQDIPLLSYQGFYTAGVGMEHCFISFRRGIKRKLELKATYGARWLKWLEHDFTDRKVRGSNPTSASRLPLSRLRQPGSIPALLLPLGGMAAGHRKGLTDEQLFSAFLKATCLVSQNGFKNAFLECHVSAGLTREDIFIV
ncbi:hypothetical protein CSKR_111598 [Clonorchis sinensis]|uniref:Uncharacterized protein n=1 Tax=Clonorchis sinensis TaxID=79923 RepID=A0A3R7G3R1_CLOSI|nr:hypothetical protein CSKR_111598 [Clonorchis sinensis]